MGGVVPSMWLWEGHRSRWGKTLQCGCFGVAHTSVSNSSSGFCKFNQLIGCHHHPPRVWGGGIELWFVVETLKGQSRCFIVPRPGRKISQHHLLGQKDRQNKLQCACIPFINEFCRRFGQGNVLWPFLDCFCGARVRKLNKMYTYHDELYPWIMNQ